MSACMDSYNDKINHCYRSFASKKNCPRVLDSVYMLMVFCMKMSVFYIDFG